MMNLYLSIAIYVALAIALGLGVWLFLTLQREVHQLRKVLDDCQDRLDAHLMASTTADPAKISAQRTQILNLNLHGERPDTIAEKVNLPQNEVEFTLKLAKLTSGFQPS